jgi:cation transport regulator ChaC
MQTHYFAYGSNMLSARLLARTASARPLGPALLPGWTLRFHKAGDDGSGKCDILALGPGYVVAGVVYRLDAVELARLDRVEGPGYRRRRVRVDQSGRRIDCEAYLATRIDPQLRPYDWYRQLVIAGLREHRIGAPVLQLVESTPDRPDPQPDRPARRHALEALAAFGSAWPKLHP